MFKESFFGLAGLRKVSGECKVNRGMFHKYSQDVAFFPYIFLNAYNVFNDENSLGFRMREDFYKLSNRDKSHKVIAIFGGSAVYDITSIEPFSKKLEILLRKRGKKVDVLNFGICNGTILDEINAYLLFVYNIKPDIVISYSGANDFGHAQYSDVHLNYVYSKFYIDFAYDIIQKENNFQFNIQNSSFKIINEYISKIHQFKNIVESNGGEFLYILQPYYKSKKELSPKEKNNISLYLKKNIGINTSNNVLQNLDVIYNNFDLKMKYLNLHKFFKKFNTKHTLFHDIVHLNNNGSSLVSNIIFKEIINYV